MKAERRSRARTPILFVAILLIGAYGLSTLTSTIFGLSEANMPLLFASGLILIFSLILLTRIIYQIDRRNGRVKKTIKWFEPHLEGDEHA